MENKKKLVKTIFEFLVFTLIMGFIVTQFMGTTYAVMSPGNPNVVITIDKDGRVSQEGNLFGDDLWYPTEEGRDGVIRIYNNYKKTKLTSLGVAVELNKFREDYTEDAVYQSFLDNMKLTIKKGRWLEFGDTSIVQDRSLADFRDGIELEENDQLTITATSPIDLKYTLRMDEEAGNELQNLSADIDFLITTPIVRTNDDKPRDDDKPANDTGVKTVAEEAVVKYPEIEGHWAHDCIIALLEQKIIQGDEFGRIRPDDYITRAEAAVLIGKALKLEPKDTLIPKYVDPIPKWAAGYVNVTSEEKIFKGYPFGLFKANNNITREEMIAVLARAFKLALDDESIELPFTDKDDIGNWALEHVRAGFEDKVILGYPDNTYKPQNNITRAEAFTIICKLLGYHDTHTQKL